MQRPYKVDMRYHIQEAMNVVWGHHDLDLCPPNSNQFLFNSRIYFLTALGFGLKQYARHRERGGGRKRERDGDHKHLSSRMRQVFNLRIKTVWKFISMLMALCLSRPDEATSSDEEGEEEEEIHLNYCHNNTQSISIHTLLPQREKTFNSTWLTIKHHQALQSNHLTTAVSM